MDGINNYCERDRDIFEALLKQEAEIRRYNMDNELHEILRLASLVKAEIDLMILAGENKLIYMYSGHVCANLRKLADMIAAYNRRETIDD